MSEAPRAARRAGVFAAVVLAVAVGAGSYRVRRNARARAPVPNPAPRATLGSVERAASAVASLASAVETLSEIQAKRSVTPSPPPPEAFATPTECARTYLPAVDVPDGSLDFLCGETESWALERRMYECIAHRPGDGVTRWTRLGHYSLAALATIRSGCCPSPPRLRAVVPGLWCGVLRDELRAFGPVPTVETVRPFDETLACLRKRGVRLPERWDRISVARSREAFEQFWRIAEARGEVRN